MIRIILWRADEVGVWQQAAIHSFVSDSNGSRAVAIVEDLATGALSTVPVKPGLLKFQLNMEAWMKYQAQAQKDAQARAVNAGPGHIQFPR